MRTNDRDTLRDELRLGATACETAEMHCLHALGICRDVRDDGRILSIVNDVAALGILRLADATWRELAVGLRLQDLLLMLRPGVARLRAA